MIIILKIFSPNILAKILAFFTQTTPRFCQKFDHNTGIWGKRHFFADNWKKFTENCDYKIGPSGHCYEHYFR
jgi:hypothetical protein